MSIREDIQHLKTLTKDELVDLRVELQIDRLTIDSDLKTAEDEGRSATEWYNKATYAYKAKAIVMTAIDTEINRRKLEVTWDEVFHQVIKDNLSKEVYNDLRGYATNEYNRLKDRIKTND
jgi:hypothetical protein